MVEVSDLDEDDLADCVDGDGEGTFNLVKILLNKLVGKSVPLQDRMTVAGEWRKVTVTVTEEDATVGVLRSEWGELLDEPPDTPKGELSIVESIHALDSEWGMYYRLAPDVVAQVRAAP